MAALGLLMSPADTLMGWHDFYLLVGTAWATLLGLLFVALSLGRGFLTQSAPKRHAHLHEPGRGVCFGSSASLLTYESTP